MMRLAIASCGLLFALSSPAAAATLTVANTASLWTALKASGPGDVIQLKSGSYGVLELNRMTFAAPGVTVSAAPGARPMLTSLVTKDSTGLTFVGLEVAMAPTQQYGIYAFGSARIRYDGMTVHQASEKLAGAGFLIRESKDVAITNSELHHLGVGGGVLDSAEVTVANSNFHDIDTDGVDIGGSAGAVVSNNRFSDFFPSPGAHPDAIQLWQTKEHPMPAGSVVKDNIIRRGKGRVMQGIFVESQSNITIVGNAMSGTMTNGIAVSGTKTADIRDNFVQGYRDMGVRIIARGGSSNITVSGNVAPLVVDLRQGNEPGTVNFVENKTSRIRDAAVGDDSAMDAWLAKRGRKP